MGFLIPPLVLRVGRGFFKLCFVLLGAEMLVGLTGFVLHLQADLNASGKNLFDKAVHGAPIFAPTLFCDLAILAAIGLWVLGWKHPSDVNSHRQ